MFVPIPRDSECLAELAILWPAIVRVVLPVSPDIVVRGLITMRTTAPRQTIREFLSSNVQMHLAMPSIHTRVTLLARQTEDPRVVMKWYSALKSNIINYYMYMVSLYNIETLILFFIATLTSKL